MRATPVLASLVLLWAAPYPARAGFKLKLTHLADVEPVVTWDADVPPPAPPPALQVLLCFHPPGCAGETADGGTAIPGITPLADLTPVVRGIDPASGPWPDGGSGGPENPRAGSGTGAGGLESLGPATVSNPEPAGLTLAATGIIGLAAYGWRRRAAGPSG